MLKAVLGSIILAAALGAAAPVFAQDYPSRPLRIVVPFPPGGAVDLWARLIAEKLRDAWGQGVLVENRAGAAGNIGGEYVAKSAPDGYTLMMGNAPVLVINKLIYPRLAYDPSAFVPVGLVYASPFVLMVRQKLAAATLAQLIAFAKANPGQLSYASVGAGTSTHLAAELFISMVGTRILHVPYKGTAAAFTDLIGEQVDMTFTELGGALPHINSGKLRVLAVGSRNRVAALPDVPAFAEALPGFFAMSWAGVVAPAGTPPAIVNRLSGAIADVLKQPDIVKRAAGLNAELLAGSPADMARFVREESERWGNVARITGATAE